MYKFNNVSLNPSLLFNMRKQVFTAIAAVAISGVYASAQQPEVVVEEESLTVVEEVPCENHYYSSGSDPRHKSTTWAPDIAAGLQLRFRLCKYVDFFAEGRVQFLGDVFNGTAYGVPADLNISAIGGFSFNIGGREFSRYNPCDYTGYISNLNNQVNDLRAALATTGAALAAAEAQLPCPEVEVAEATVVEAAPLMATVRFSLNSARIVPQEKVNVYNIAQWMKENPEQNVAIVGYADADTGTAAYNMTLSKRRAQAVYDMLTGEYGVDSSRLSIVAEGSDKQVYEENNWNRIVIFNVAE